MSVVFELSWNVEVKTDFPVMDLNLLKKLFFSISFYAMLQANVIKLKAKNKKKQKKQVIIASKLRIL